MERNSTIDIAKGIGIILVVYAHTKCLAHDAIYLFHMPLFFALSGYFFNYKRDIFENIKNKFQNLFVAYFFYFFLCWILFIGISDMFGSKAYFDWRYLLHPGGVVGQLWFFIGLFWVCILYSFISKLKNRYLISSICLLLGIIGYVLSYYNIKLPYFIDSALSMMPFYCIGFLLKEYKIMGIKNNKINITIICLSIIFYIIGLLFLTCLDTKSNKIPSNFPLHLISTTSAIILIFYISKYLSKYNIGKVLSLLGKESITIFVWHIFAFNMYYLIFKTSFYKLDYTGGILISLFAIVFSFVFGIIQNHYLPIPKIKEIMKVVKEKLFLN